MAIRVNVTSGWSKFALFLKIMGILGYMLLIYPLFIPMQTWPEWVQWVIGIPVIALPFIVFRYTLSDPLDTLGAYLYIRITLKTPITFKEAKMIRWMFMPNSTGNWWPMAQIKDLPIETRHNSLMSAAKRIESELLLKKDS